MIGNGVDNDCDGYEVCYANADAYGYAATGGVTVASADPDCADAGEARDFVPRTDCCDADARAYPGQPSFYSTARTTCGGYDFDCDGAETLQLVGGPPVSTCAACAGMACDVGCEVTVAGWVSGETPACGVGADHLSTCRAFAMGTSCGDWVRFVTQRCR